MLGEPSQSSRSGCAKTTQPTKLVRLNALCLTQQTKPGGERVIRKDQFSRKQTMDLRLAMASALVRFLQGMTFEGPGGYGIIQLETGFAEWPSVPDEYVGPACAVLPGLGTDIEGRLIPTLIEDTWEPRGQPGWGLYVLSDYEVEFKVRIRAASAAERDALIMGIEQAFVQEPNDMLIAPEKGNRYGTLLDLPEYFASQARFGLKETNVLDDPDSAMAEQREAEFTVMGQAKKMRVGLVQPFTVKVVVDPDDPLPPAPTNQLT
jgi:hypothetical protein